MLWKEEDCSSYSNQRTGIIIISFKEECTFYQNPQQDFSLVTPALFSCHSVLRMTQKVESFYYAV